MKISEILPEEITKGSIIKSVMKDNKKTLRAVVRALIKKRNPEDDKPELKAAGGEDTTDLPDNAAMRR